MPVWESKNTHEFKIYRNLFKKHALNTYYELSLSKKSFFQNSNVLWLTIVIMKERAYKLDHNNFMPIR